MLKPGLWIALGLILNTPLPSFAREVPFSQSLSPEAIRQQLKTIPGWRLEGPQLVCTYRFTNFVQSVDFVNRLVAPSERLQHHPDLTVTYSQVTIRLTTHDANGLTQLDFQLAQAIAQLRQSQPGCI
jgi:4a-hydroxytetrahydrobiopterin dehydratase